MFVMTMKLDRKKIAFAVVMAALVIIGIILLIGAFSGHSDAEPRTDTSARTEKNRVAYIAQCGWEVESPALNSQTVIIPRSFSEVFEQYNELQKTQGFDLSRYCGMEVEAYTYKVLNDPSGDDVVAQMYVLNGEVIGGDVHSTSLNGFMVGLKK